MFYHDKKLQYPVRVDNPDPLFARMLQQALGGVEGEIRVVLQYLFQASNSRGASKYRHLILETASEDMGHAEMFATAIALNLEGSKAELQEQAAESNPMVAAVMGGMSSRQYLSGGMGALCADSEGNPFDGSWVVSSGNIAADMFANVTIEVSNATLAARLMELTDDPGMKDMLGFLVARDNMHAQQWLAVIEELGGFQGALPIPNSFDRSDLAPFQHTFFSTAIDGISPPLGRWSSGPSIDRKGEFEVKRLVPMGTEPRLGPPIPEAYAQTEEMQGGRRRVVMNGTDSESIASRLSAGIKHVMDDLTGGQRSAT